MKLRYLRLSLEIAVTGTVVQLVFLATVDGLSYEWVIGILVGFWTPVPIALGVEWVRWRRRRADGR